MTPLRPATVALAHRAARLSAKIGRRRINDIALAQRLTADQHAKHHLVSAGQRHLCGNHLTTQTNVHDDDQAILGVPRRTANRASIVHRSFDEHLV